MNVKYGQLHYDFGNRCVVTLTVNGCGNTAAGRGVRINGAVYEESKIMRFK